MPRLEDDPHPADGDLLEQLELAELAADPGVASASELRPAGRRRPAGVRRRHIIGPTRLRTRVLVGEERDQVVGEIRMIGRGTRRDRAPAGLDRLEVDRRWPRIELPLAFRPHPDSVEGWARSWIASAARRGGLELLAELLQTPLQQPGDGAGRPVEARTDLGQRATLPVMQDQGLPLVERQQGQRVGQPDGLLVSLCVLAGRRAIGGQPGAEPDRRRGQLLLERRSRLTSRLSRPWARNTSETFRARIALSQARRSASLSPRNCSRFWYASRSVSWTTSDGSSRPVGLASSCMRARSRR